MFGNVRYIFACLAVLLIASQGHAKRIIDAEIALFDGRIILLASGGDDGKADEETVWRYLKRYEFRTSRDLQIRPDPGNPLQATLEGKIKVTINYGGSASVNRLRLIRASKDVTEWRIHPDDVEQMLKQRK